MTIKRVLLKNGFNGPIIGSADVDDGGSVIGIIITVPEAEKAFTSSCSCGKYQGCEACKKYKDVPA